jgi:putative aldouronate transport system permease protein
MKFLNHKSGGIFSIIINTVFLFISFITIYPFLYVLSMSISGEDAVLTMKVWLYPVGFTLRSYGLLFQNNDIITAFFNSVWYVVVGTSINIFATTTAAYALSRKKFFARNFLLIMISITMIFDGGLIPTFIIVKNLGLYNSRWVIVLLGAVSPWMLLMNRTYFDTTIPESLIEAAFIDGYNDLKIFFKIILPLSKPILAVLGMIYGVSMWNSWFSALIYLSDQKMAPIQLVLRKIVLTQSNNLLSGLSGMEMVAYRLQLKYAAIIVVVAPILAVYPFAQKYFMQGVMIGAIKE